MGKILEEARAAREAAQDGEDEVIIIEDASAGADAEDASVDDSEFFARGVKTKTVKKKDLPENKKRRAEKKAMKGSRTGQGGGSRGTGGRR